MNVPARAVMPAQSISPRSIGYSYMAGNVLASNVAPPVATFGTSFSPTTPGTVSAYNPSAPSRINNLKPPLFGPAPVVGGATFQGSPPIGPGKSVSTIGGPVASPGVGVGTLSQTPSGFGRIGGSGLQNFASALFG